MNKIKTVILCCVVAAGSFAADKPDVIEMKFKNRDSAIHLMNDWMRDPFITQGPDGYFYLSCTRLDHLPGKVQGLEIWRSKDLKQWENIGVPWQVADSAWLPEVIAKTDVKHAAKKYLLWAPEIWYVDGRWIGLHTSNIGKANLFQNESKELKGPFAEPMGMELGRRHDPSLFEDDDGSLWLVWGCAQIRQLKPELSGFIGKEYEIGPANRKMGHEGCQIIKVGKKYVLFGTAWSSDEMRHGTYNLYYCTADNITGPYGPRKFAGRCLGHGTVFQGPEGEWWCTAFYNANKPTLTGDEINSKDVRDTAYTLNRQGLTLVPMNIEMHNGDVVVEALDPAYAKPGAEEVQQF